MSDYKMSATEAAAAFPLGFVELRWVDWGITQELEYRSLCPSGDMSEWKRVLGVDARSVYPEKFSGPQEPS